MNSDSLYSNEGFSNVGLMVSNYQIRQGSSLDRAQLVKFMERTYREIYPQQETRHLARTVDGHLSPDTPLWWAEVASEPGPVGCLWLGNAVDQTSGQRHAYVLLLYVAPDYRRQGIATELLEVAQSWAQQRGDRQISLQVFHDNQPALSLYQKLGYLPSAITLSKTLKSS